jgi:hypothetical protein
MRAGAFDTLDGSSRRGRVAPKVKTAISMTSMSGVIDRFKKIARQPQEAVQTLDLS